MEPQTALLIAVAAAVVGQILGAALTLFGGYINDHFAHKREERQQDREDQKLTQQRQREERERLRQARLNAYTQFAQATSQPGEQTNIPDRREALNKSYVETLMYASESVASEAQELYEAASHAFDPTHTPDTEWSNLQDLRAQFIEQVRIERDD
jgi:hypothetical protein